MSVPYFRYITLQNAKWYISFKYCSTTSYTIFKEIQANADIKRIQLFNKKETQNLKSLHASKINETIRKQQCEYINIEENIIVEARPIASGPVYHKDSS